MAMDYVTDLFDRIFGNNSEDAGNPENTANDVAKANSTAADKDLSENFKKRTDIKRNKVTHQMLSYPDNMDNTEEFPHQIQFNVLVRTSDSDTADSQFADLPPAGYGEDLMSQGLSNEGANEWVRRVSSAALVGTSVAYALGSNANLVKKAAAVTGAGVLSRWFGDNMAKLTTPSLTRKNVASIRMAMPQSPQNKMQAEWDVTDFGALMGAMAQADGDKGLAEMIKSADMQTEAGQTLMRTAAGALNITKQLGLNLPLQSSIELMTRKVNNPFKETLFKTMGFRNFPFVFKFAPKNRNELLQTLKIINVFERYMAPQKSPGQLFLEYPAEFEIVYMYKGKENAYFTNFFNDTALTSFQVDYGSGGIFTAFQGTEGAPTEITMSLGFQELTLLDRDKIVDFTDQQEVMGGFDQSTMLPTVQGEPPKPEQKPTGNEIDETTKAD